MAETDFPEECFITLSESITASKAGQMKWMTELISQHRRCHPEQQGSWNLLVGARMAEQHFAWERLHGLAALRGGLVGVAEGLWHG